MKEAYKQLEDKDVYEEVPNDSSILNNIMRALEKIRIRGDLPNDALNYFLVKDLKFDNFYLLPKIDKRLDNVPGRPIISNCGFYTENISSFLGHHLRPISQKVNLFIKDLRKIKSLGQLLEGDILCTNLTGVVLLFTVRCKGKCSFITLTLVNVPKTYAITRLRKMGLIRLLV